MAAVTQPTLRWHELPEEAWDTYFLPSSLWLYMQREPRLWELAASQKILTGKGEWSRYAEP